MDRSLVRGLRCDRREQEQTHTAREEDENRYKCRNDVSVRSSSSTRRVVGAAGGTDRPAPHVLSLLRHGRQTLAGSGGGEGVCGPGDLQDCRGTAAAAKVLPECSRCAPRFRLCRRSEETDEMVGIFLTIMVHERLPPPPFADMKEHIEESNTRTQTGKSFSRG